MMMKSSSSSSRETPENGDTEDENCKDNEIIEQFLLRCFFLSRSGVINP